MPGFLADGFAEDCDDLLRKFLSFNNLNYHNFCKAWKEMDFSCIFHGRVLGAETAELSEDVIHIAKQFMTDENSSFGESVGALFLIYALVHTQPYKRFAPLRLVPEDVTKIKSIESSARQRKKYDVIYILGSLLIEGPVEYHVSPRPYGMERNYRKSLHKNYNSKRISLHKGVMHQHEKELNILRALTVDNRRYYRAKAFIHDQEIPERCLNYADKNLPSELLISLKNIVKKGSWDTFTEAQDDERHLNNHEVILAIKERAMKDTVKQLHHLTALKDRYKENENSSTPSPRTSQYITFLKNKPIGSKTDETRTNQPSEVDIFDLSLISEGTNKIVTDTGLVEIEVIDQYNKNDESNNFQSQGNTKNTKVKPTVTKELVKKPKIGYDVKHKKRIPSRAERSKEKAVLLSKSIASLVTSKNSSVHESESSDGQNVQIRKSKLPCDTTEKIKKKLPKKLTNKSKGTDNLTIDAANKKTKKSKNFNVIKNLKLKTHSEKEQNIKKITKKTTTDKDNEKFKTSEQCQNVEIDKNIKSSQNNDETQSKLKERSTTEIDSNEKSNDQSQNETEQRKNNEIEFSLKEKTINKHIHKNSENNDEQTQSELTEKTTKVVKDIESQNETEHQKNNDSDETTIKEKTVKKHIHKNVLEIHSKSTEKSAIEIDSNDISKNIEESENQSAINFSQETDAIKDTEKYNDLQVTESSQNYESVDKSNIELKKSETSEEAPVEKATVMPAKHRIKKDLKNVLMKSRLKHFGILDLAGEFHVSPNDEVSKLK